MIELHALMSAARSGATQGGDNLTPAQQRNLNISMSIIIIIELILFVWAIFRAIKCSQASPDSRAIHLLFATVSPFLYLIFSYVVDGFCAK
jgi:hypothetical protein